LTFIRQAAPTAPALAGTEGSLDALACAVDAMCRELERVGAPSILSLVGDSATVPTSSTSASL
jgi:hypothetical protein